MKVQYMSRAHRRRIPAVVAEAGGGGWWLSGGIGGGDCVAAYQAKGAASYAASLVDLSDAGNDATEGVAPTWATETGWTFDGVNDYLDSGVTPLTDQTWSMIIDQEVLSSSGWRAIVGISGGNNRGFIMAVNNSGTQFQWYNGGVALGGAISNCVRAIAGNAKYIDGTVDAGSIPADVVTLAYTMAIGSTRNTSGDPVWHCNCVIRSMAIYDVALTADQVAAVTTAMQAL